MVTTAFGARQTWPSGGLGQSSRRSYRLVSGWHRSTVPLTDSRRLLLKGFNTAPLRSGTAHAGLVQDSVSLRDPVA
jgi:cell division FtsZ-interacting protein ZapD